MPTKLTDAELLAIVDAEFNSAMGTSGGEIAAERAKAWDYYLSKPLGNEIEGQSKVVTADVSEVVDSIMPSMLRIFTTADNLLNFEPQGEEDEEAAAQESDYVSYVFFRQNDGFKILYDWFFDAFVQKNGVVKAWWDDRETKSRETYQGLTDEELTLLLDDEELALVEHEERTGVVARDIATVIGVIPQEVEATVHDVIFERTSKHGQVRVGVVPPEEYRISSDAQELDPSSARMVGQEREVTRSELIETGFDQVLVDQLPGLGASLALSPEKIARRDKTDETDDVPHDRSQDKVLVREGYIKVDYDGDGRSELRQAFTGGNRLLTKKKRRHTQSRDERKLLSNEEVDRQPFHVLCPHPLPHKHFGRATAEKVMDVQQVNTTLLRQTLDNLYRSNMPGHAVWEHGIGENTLDDLLTERVGRIVRFNRPPSEAYQPISVPFTAAATFPMLEFFDKVKRDRTGISSDSQGLSPDALKNIQISVLANAMDLSRMKVEAIARIFAETGMRSLFLHIHELLLKHQRKDQLVKLRNRWVRVDPREWRTRRNMTVNIGLGIGTREQNLLHLNAIWEKQKEMATLGGMNMVVRPRNFFNTGAEMVKNANLKQPAMFFTDPGDASAPPPSDQQQQLAALQAELEQRRQQLDAREQEIKFTRLRLDSDAERAKHLREIEKLRLQREEADDKLTLGMEAIRNKLTELELKFNTNVPGARV